MTNKFYEHATEATIDYFSFASSGPSVAASTANLNEALAGESIYQTGLSGGKLLTDIVASVDSLIRPIAELPISIRLQVKQDLLQERLED